MSSGYKREDGAIRQSHGAGHYSPSGPASETVLSSAAGVWLATCPPAVPPEELPGLKTAPLLKVMSPFQGSPPLGPPCRENGPQALSPAQDLTEDLPTSVLSAVEVKASSTL